MLKKILKFFRGSLLVNKPVRYLVKSLHTFSNLIFAHFSVHWPVYGIIRFSLPNKQNVKIYSRGDDYVSTQAYWKGYEGYEGPSIKLFYHLTLQTSVVIDIGANIGYYTLIGAMANKQALIYSFEPVPSIYQRLVKNCSINNLKNTRLVNAAVGNLEGSIKFYMPSGSKIALAGSTKKGWITNTDEIEVTSVTLDQFKSSEKIPRIGLIKIDCEFHEVEALLGMKALLQTDKPIIIMEILFPEAEGIKGHFENDYYLEIERIMRENGYYFYLINEKALIRMDKLEYNPEERNYLFSTKKSTQVYLSFSDMNALIGQVTFNAG
jgi:FkbM family methyltransferase